MSAELHAAALSYASHGWPVVPLWWPVDGRCACPQAEQCPSPGKHPLTPHGLDDASMDPATLADWSEQWPQANVGLRTGVAFDVLDLDSDAAGIWLANHALEQGAPMPECWGWGPMAATGKGSHLYYAPTGAGNRSRVAGVDGFDWRGRGGYVVAPPSLHVSGRRYEWHPDCGPDTPIPAAPDFLVDLVVRKPQPASSPQPASQLSQLSHGTWSPSGLIATVATAAEGERNQALNWAAHKVGLDVAAGKVDDATAIVALEQLAVAAERTGLRSSEVDATIRSGYTAGRRGATA